jgi:hypothetical protein
MRRSDKGNWRQDRGGGRILTIMTVGQKRLRHAELNTQISAPISQATLCEQGRRLHLQDRRDLGDVLQGDIFFAPFDTAHVGPIQLREQGKLLLRNPLLLARVPHRQAEAVESRIMRAMRRHCPRSLAIRRIYNHRIYQSFFCC